MRLAAYISFDALSDVTVVLGMRQSIHSKTLSQFISPIPSFKGKTIISQPFFTHFFYDKQNQYFSCLTFLLAALQLHFQFLSILRYQFRGPLFGNRDKDTIIDEFRIPLLNQAQENNTWKFLSRLTTLSDCIILGLTSRMTVTSAHPQLVGFLTRSKRARSVTSQSFSG